MNRTPVVLLTLVTALSLLLYVRITPLNVKATNGSHVHNLNTGLNYTTIQQAIDADQTKNGHTILVDDGTYYEHVLLNKSLSIIGQSTTNTIIDGNGNGIAIHVTAPAITIKQLTIRNATIGINLDHSEDSIFIDDNLNHNTDGIQIRYSNNATLSQNIIANNTGRGALITNSQNFKVSRNYVSHNGWSTYQYGVNANASSNGLIMQNVVCNNYFDGIGLLDSRNCTIIENSVKDNAFFGIWLDSSNGNNIYHNNIINNTGKQATAATSRSTWDNRYPSGGNYWSNYTGVDANRDGIGDTSYFVDVNNNTDRYPLMGMFTRFNTSLGYDVNIVSNSTINNFNFVQTNPTIKITVTNASSTQSFGFCRVCIPKNLMGPPYTVIIDDGATSVLIFNDTLYDNGTHRWIYFAYPQTAHEVVIVPEFPQLLILGLAIIVSLLIVITRKKMSLPPLIIVLGRTPA